MGRRIPGPPLHPLTEQNAHVLNRPSLFEFEMLDGYSGPGGRTTFNSAEVEIVAVGNVTHWWK